MQKVKDLFAVFVNTIVAVSLCYFALAIPRAYPWPWLKELASWCGIERPLEKSQHNENEKNAKGKGN